MVIQRIKNWLKPKEVAKIETIKADKPIIIKGHNTTIRYACDVCKEDAKHIAIVESDTGKHVIGAKCDEHIAMVIRQMANEKFTGTRIQEPQPVHFAGFKSSPYSEWYECSCPKGSTHYILSNDSRLLPEE